MSSFFSFYQYLKGLLFSCVVWIPTVWAISQDHIRLGGNDIPENSIGVNVNPGQEGINDIFVMIQNILLTVVLPVVVVGVGLYIAYLLFSADGDDARMKQAWKAVAFSAVALILIALAYALVALISRLDFS